jgi:hypothetical protein
MIKPLLVLLLFFVGKAVAQDTVQYHLRISNAVQHLAGVQAQYQVSASATPIVQIPNWRTGR